MCSFDTSSVDNFITDAFHSNQNVLIVIKLTIPVGHTKLKVFQLLIFGPIFSGDICFYLLGA